MIRRMCIFDGHRTLLFAAAFALVILAAAPGRAQQTAPAQAAGVPALLTLKQAVAAALRNSSDVSLAQLRYQQAQRETNLVRSQFLPNLYAGSGAAYTNGFPLLAGGGAPAVLSLSYNQALFDPLARSDTRVASQRAEEQRLAVDAARDAVIVRVATSYLELAKTRHELDLMRRERESAQRILDFSRERSEAGFELPIEVTRSQLTAARVDQRIAQLEDEDDTLTDQFRDALGLPTDQLIEVAAEDLPAVADQATNELVARALENNADLKQAESEQDASAEHLRGEQGSRWPTIGIIGQYNVLAKFNNYDLFFNKFQRNNVIVGIDIKVPLFASHTSSGIAAARADLTAAQQLVRNKRAELTLDVRHQARQAHELDLARQVAQLELQLAQQNLQVLQSQFDQGRASVRDLQAAQLDENDKWLLFLDADFARQQAQLELLRTTGQVASLFP